MKEDILNAYAFQKCQGNDMEKIATILKHFPN